MTKTRAARLPVTTKLKSNAASRNGEDVPSSEGVRAVGRALDILLAFTSAEPIMTASTLLKRVDLTRPTLYRMLATLEQLGFIVSEGDPQRFRLGPRIGELGRAWTAGLDVVRIAAPFLEQLWSETGETVALYIRQGSVRVCLSELPSTQPLNFRRGVGYQNLLSIGASGRAILAHIDDLRDEMERLAAEAGLEPRELAAKLQAIRERGFEVSYEELLKGSMAIAAPFFGPTGVVGSIAVFGPTARLDATTVDIHARRLLAQASAVSAALGAEKLGRKPPASARAPVVRS